MPCFVRSLALVLALLVGAGARAGAAPSDVVVTSAGSVVGTTDGGVRTYVGIPYAAPPIEALRWRPPLPVIPWTDVRDASNPGPECEQPIPPHSMTPDMSEDCLTVNVWTPAKFAGAHLPVIVFIYGGGWVGGSATLPVYDGTALAKHGVLVVTFNYRVGIFGFLAHPQLTAESHQHTSGNYGILDQLAALHWVQTNIGAFGGDPANVTLAGESAGAASVSALLTTPQAKGLFVRAIMESPPILRPEYTLAQAEAIGTKLAAGDSIATLRTLPAADLLKRLPPLDADTRADQAQMPGPIADGVVLPDERSAYASGAFTALPLIVGSNAAEGSFFAARVPVKTIDQYAAALQRRFGARSAQALALYPALTDADANAAEATLVGDLDINLGTRAVARLMAARGVPVYRYLFAKTRNGKSPGHTAELPYVFGNGDFDGLGMPTASFDRSDYAVSNAMMTAWTNFAKTGNPNPFGSVAWPAYSTSDDRYIVFDDPITTGAGFRRAQLDFLAPLR